MAHSLLPPWGRRRPGLLLAIALCAAVGSLAAPAPSPANAPGPHWAIFSTSLPTYFKPGDASDEYTLIVMNDGGQATSSVATVADALPHGLTPTAISGVDSDRNRSLTCTLRPLACTTTAEVDASDVLLITITVSVAAQLGSTETNLVSVTGGGAPSASTSEKTQVSASPIPFGLSYLVNEIVDTGGGLDTRAGSHPWQMTTGFSFNSASLEAKGLPLLNAEARDIEVALPPGLDGDPHATPTCSQATFQTGPNTYNCPADTQVGILRLLFYAGGNAAQTVPVYNIAAPPGKPAELGFTVGPFEHVPMFFHIRSERDYGLTVRMEDVSEADPVRVALLTLWGVPADASHDSLRTGQPGCTGGGCGSEVAPKPFLTMPTHCPAEGAPGIDIMSDSWQSPGLRDGEDLAELGDPSWVTLGSSLPPFTGCGRLSFDPSVAVSPDTTQAGSPSGYTIDLQVPQGENPAGLATPALQDATLALAAGTVLSPGAADGLEACTDEQFAVHALSAAACPPASQVGTVVVHTPLLSNPLEGQLYVGRPDCAPCSPGDAAGGRMLRLFLQALGSGVTLKLEGRGFLGQDTGVMTTTFPEDPQLPFNDLHITLTGGPRAPLANPTACGPAGATTDLRPWSSPFTPDATPASSFEVTGCPAAQFHPAASAGTTNNQAGAFSPFTVTLARSDQEQDLKQIMLSPPPGVLGMLSRVTLCEEPQAAQDSCPAASRVGQVTLAAGPGTSPLYLPQAGRPEAPVYMTGPYRGAPFGLLIVVPALAGPYDLGTVTVRAGIYVDPHSARITIVSDPLPTLIDGIPLHLRMVNITVDREGFIFNPTNCSALELALSTASDRGMSATLSSPFHAVNCATLAFHPSLTASTQGRTSRLHGASLEVKVSYPRGAAQANIRSMKVRLPRQMSARLTTLQHACPEAAFAANPATCPAASVVGNALASTPVLDQTMSGPAYLVSRGGGAFPDLVIVLQGQGVRLDLTGATSIAGGITTSTFASVPDAPFRSFQLKLPQGPHSALAGLSEGGAGGLCSATLSMPTTIVAQSGARIARKTKLAVGGCPKARKRRRAPARGR